MSILQPVSAVTSETVHRSFPVDQEVICAVTVDPADASTVIEFGKLSRYSLLFLLALELVLLGISFGVYLKLTSSLFLSFGPWVAMSLGFGILIGWQRSRPKALIRAGPGRVVFQYQAERHEIPDLNAVIVINRRILPGGMSDGEGVSELLIRCRRAEEDYVFYPLVRNGAYSSLDSLGKTIANAAMIPLEIQNRE